MKKLRCTMCILAFSSFTTLIQHSEWAEVWKARMHNVHHGFFILHLNDISTSRELKDEKARMRMCFFVFFSSFCSLISALSVSWRLKKKLGCTMCILAFSFFSYLISALSVSWRMKKLGCTMCIRAFSSFSSLSSAHPGFLVLQVTDFSAQGWKS